MKTETFSKIEIESANGTNVDITKYVRQCELTTEYAVIRLVPESRWRRFWRWVRRVFVR